MNRRDSVVAAIIICIGMLVCTGFFAQSFWPWILAALLFLVMFAIPAMLRWIEGIDEERDRRRQQERDLRTRAAAAADGGSDGTSETGS